MRLARFLASVALVVAGVAFVAGGTLEIALAFLSQLIANSHSPPPLSMAPGVALALSGSGAITLAIWLR